MNSYVTGAIIKKLREERKMTQLELAEKLCVSDKAVSRWETGKGYPDITLVEPIAGALGISAAELLAGCDVRNTNRGFNMLRMMFYVCPICGNVITGTGEAMISCCGVTLPPLETEAPDEAHAPTLESVEDEFYISFAHEMTKEHFISFVAAVSDNGLQMTKLYPEGSADARVKRGRVRYLYWYCNRHGMFRTKI